MLKYLLISFIALGGLVLAWYYPRPVVQPTPTVVVAPKVCFSDTTTTAELLTFTNQQRATQGLAPLVDNPSLDQAATLKAQDMISAHYWAHISPSGVTPWHWFNVVGYPYSHAGENLAESYPSSQAVISAWLASPEHRANLFRTTFNEVGLAVTCGTTDKPTTLVVAEYGAR